jgi:osmotically-inducible protein OsmY
MTTLRSALFAAMLSVAPLPLTVPVVATAEVPCPKTIELGAASADRRATEEIQRRIAADETLSPSGRRVEVSTSEGVVTLSGKVESAEDRLVLADLAEGTPGVRRVEDRLEVRR